MPWRAIRPRKCVEADAHPDESWRTDDCSITRPQTAPQSLLVSQAYLSWS